VFNNNLPCSATNKGLNFKSNTQTLLKISREIKVTRLILASTVKKKGTCHVIVTTKVARINSNKGTMTGAMCSIITNPNTTTMMTSLPPN
jgi:hypothetical protein